MLPADIPNLAEPGLEWHVIKCTRHLVPPNEDCVPVVFFWIDRWELRNPLTLHVLTFLANVSRNTVVNLLRSTSRHITQRIGPSTHYTTRISNIGTLSVQAGDQWFDSLFLPDPLAFLPGPLHFPINPYYSRTRTTPDLSPHPDGGVRDMTLFVNDGVPFLP